ncbi:E3 ubiquitin-protein ligase At1g63170-like [Bidens hawaiensis]|uniref:E3 ubiquitin-protein ligase At1g63170-like n=1 Tax=Bidens hawaiensis TaxID=980011 RepID=UPI00404A323A
MDVTTEEQNNIDQATDSYPLLVETREHRENEHVIDLETGDGNDGTSSSSNGSNSSLNGLARSPRASGSQLVRASSTGSNSLGRRGDGLGRRRWSPFDTLLWISIKLGFTLGQIIASVVVLYISRNENPQTPLFAWIVGYAAGCVASLPFLYWRYLHRNQASESGSNQARQPPSEGTNHQPEPNSYITISFARSSEEENRPAMAPDTWNGLNVGSNARLTMLVDHFKMALDCFSAVWFVVGNVWIFGGHSSAAEAPNLYRLCIVFLTFSCIGYAMPFILCGMICCCLPCIISILGVHEDMNQMRGASEDSINALPTHKFKLKKNGNYEMTKDNNDSVVDEGGILAPGTEKERAISGEDAVCCICLAKYADNDLLRELPCNHFFHIECVDKWLKINASCPLCKFEIKGSNDISSTQDSSPQQA